MEIKIKIKHRFKAWPQSLILIRLTRNKLKTEPEKKDEYWL